ncbi:MAG: amino acid permease [Bacteroidetes bacterium]|nr:amino acid permease [Bacteroidota bacterium]
MIDMVGIGPFVVLYMVIQISAGPDFLYAWIVGACLSFADALIWSELGATYPHAGGSYNFLKVAYGEEKWGRLFSFLYVWQTMIQAPLVMASAAIGFAEYLGFFVPLEIWQAKVISGIVVIAVVILLYRKIEAIGKISVIMWICIIVIFTWIISGGIIHGNMFGPLKHINDDLVLNKLFFVALGQASVKTIYTYLGYYNVCHLGGEIMNPGKNIPRSMLISVAGIAVLYLLMNLSVTSVIPWQEAMKNKFVVSEYIRTVSGPHAAGFATGIILIVAFSSLFSATLGYSRVPYAAAKDGAFFPVFARLHPTKNFPHISLLFLGALGFIFSLLFKMKHAIDGILAMRILIQFVSQAVGVVILRKKFGTKNLPFKMWLYPLPIIVSISIWLWIFFSTGYAAFIALIFIAIGVVVFYLTKNLWEKIA